MRSLSQAPRLGGLHRASRLPFKVSFFTSAEHPANATTQRLIAHLIWAMETLVVIDPCFISSSRLVAHALQSIADVELNRFAVAANRHIEIHLCNNSARHKKPSHQQLRPAIT